MSIRSNTPHIRHLLAAALLLPLLTACSFMSEDYYDCDKEPPTTTSPERYINLSIVVSAGNENATRAPQGGEDGDGRETGSERENKVTGITLMLYRDGQDENDKGINTDNPDTKIDFIRYYKVDKTKTSGENIEASYTTGYQPLAGTDIKLGVKYHAIVVANKNLTGEVFVGSSVAVVREKVISDIYERGGIGIDAENFVMASEKDFDFKLKDPTSEVVDGKPALVYSLDGIRIERLAARIDFWMKGATYKTKDNNPAYETPGYEYDVTKSNGNPSKDKFVLTAVTPFNLYDGDEYFIKRITDKNYDFTNNKASVVYLGNERITTGTDHLNYVLDPYTGSKTANTVPDYMKQDYALENFLKSENSTYDAKKGLISSFRSSNGEDGEKGVFTYEENGKEGDNIIICYPKENTLWKSSPLYYYATGLCIEGDYYKNGTGTPTPLTYYGFIRHQGESTTSGVYPIVPSDQLGSYKEENENIFPMNFGVVRNNIYRISIDNITEQGNITWKIEVKNWDVFEHKTIFM